MSNTTTSQYMGMGIPVPTQDPGPQYAVDLNNCLTTIDQHNHTSGNGQQIPTIGLNINSDLPCNGYNLTTQRSSRFSAQASPISNGSDVGCIYVSGADLYYNDINGNQVRITASGAVAGTPGSIGNLVSPATVTYNSGNQTYVFQATTATPANLDCASLLIRDNTANSKAVTLNAPAALGSNYSLNLFSGLPASTKIVTCDASGNLGDIYDVDNSTLTVLSNTIQVKTNGIGPSQLNAFNYVASSGSFTTSSTSPVNVTNLSVSLPISGKRPVWVGFLPQGLPSYIQVQASDSNCDASLWIINNVNGATVQYGQFGSDTIGTPANFSAIMPPSSFFGIDLSTINSSPGTVNYYAQASVRSITATLTLRNIMLVAYEL